MNATKKPDREFEARLLEYLSDVRDRVCSLCGGRPIGDPRGNPCGTVLPLRQLVKALKEAEAGLVALPLCSPDVGSPACACPLPRKRLAVLAALAAEDVEEERQQHDLSYELLTKGDQS